MTGAIALAVAAALPLAGTTVHLDAGHNGANARHPETINRTVHAGGGLRKACDTTGTQTSDGRLTEARFTLDVAMRTERRLRGLGLRPASCVGGRGLVVRPRAGPHGQKR